MRSSILVVISVTFACVGCATQFMGTAPAQQAGSTYVAGSDSNDATLWLCDGKSECKSVDVSE